ncbi:hypothetical protein QR685DRAFT_534798 [Neurospora intermedia]|uniref:Uncharacterized protein n=1 Tax=Neurospora intermedia TaxID=5142 RepID=A0ABR3D2M2_NEUIN
MKRACSSTIQEWANWCSFWAQHTFANTNLKCLLSYQYCNYVRRYKSSNYSATHLKAVIIFHGCKFSLLAVIIAVHMHG